MSVALHGSAPNASESASADGIQPVSKGTAGNSYWVSVAGQASGIPAFYVAFCVTPFASNASELVSSLIFASRKQKKNISLTFSQASPWLHVNPCGCMLLLCMQII